METDVVLYNFLVVSVLLTSSEVELMETVYRYAN